MIAPPDTIAVLLSFNSIEQAQPTREDTQTWGFMCSSVVEAVAALRERKPAMVAAGDAAKVLAELARVQA